MFKWKIPTRKGGGGKQEKLNNEINNKTVRNNVKKRPEKDPENNRRNVSLNDSGEYRTLPEQIGAPHRAPTHPPPPELATSTSSSAPSGGGSRSQSQTPEQQPLPPHSTYPVSTTYGAPLSTATSGTSASRFQPQPSSKPRPNGVLTPTQPHPPPYVPPPAGVRGAQNGVYGSVPPRVRVKTSQSTQVEDDMRGGGGNGGSDALNTSVTSSTTEGSRPEVGSSSWMEWTQQLQAYVAWVNSQLRKKEGYKLVTDLRADLHSGVVLADLIEIVSGEKIAGIHRLPETAQMMRENVDRVLQFMATKRIRMHHVASKEVIEGNLKAVMRLILALAAHYKPQSVRTSPYDSSATTATASAPATSAGPTSTSASTPAKTSSSPEKSVGSPASTSSTSAATTSPATSASIATTVAVETANSSSAQSIPATSSTHSTPTRRPAPLSVCVTTPNLNVPGNRKSIGHLLEGALTVAPVLRRYPSVAGHQWTASGAGTNGDGATDMSPESRVDDDEITVEERPAERRGRRQWGQPGPPLYENLPRSNSFASYGGERPRIQPQPPIQSHVPTGDEGIYDVPRTRPSRVEGPRSLGIELSRTTQTDGREIVDGFSSLPRHGTKPAALDFWESITAHSTGTSSPNTSGEFRYNTIHRISGRRMLPKTPDARPRAAPGSAPAAAGSKPAAPAEDTEERSLGSRGEVEGSSSHGSPTTSIVRSREEAVAEWLRGTPARRSDTWVRPDSAPQPAELWRHSALRRSVQLESWGGAGRPTGSPAGGRPAVGSPAGNGRIYGGPPTPPEPLSYEALLEELGRARRQLVALQELVSLINGGHQAEGSDCRGTNTADEFVFLKSRLQNTSEKCNMLQADLNKAKQCLLNEETRMDDKKSNSCNGFSRKNGNAEMDQITSRLASQDRELQELRRQLADKDKAIHLQKHQFDDAIKALANSNMRPVNGKMVPLSPGPRQRNAGREEMHILRDAISSLRANFRESDPNHHTLDTLEQCMAVVLERLTAAETGRQGDPESNRPNKRAPITSLQGQASFTKVVYYTEKTLTPFLSSVPKKLGEITLRDFKQIFDRPGNYRFHFKSMDPEFGMVKEEISNDDEILPGFDGKLISWVVEDHGA